MNLLKNTFLSFASNRIGIENLIHISGQHIIFPFYHAVSDEYLPHISPLYKLKNIQSFREDIDFLLKHFQPISIEDLYLHIQGEKKITKPSFHLSFDDGLQEVHDIILPILEQKGIPATVFVNSAFVDNADLFYRYKASLIIDKNKSMKSKVLKIKYHERKLLNDLAQKLDIDFRDFLQKQQPYLTTEQLKTLQTKGFTIGAHSIDHPFYALLDEQEKIKQTLESCKYVKTNFSEKRSCFSFPFSGEGVNHSFFSKVHNSVDFTFGISGIDISKNGKHIERIWMESDAKNTKDYIQKAYLSNILKNAFNKTKTKRA